MLMIVFNANKAHFTRKFLPRFEREGFFGTHKWLVEVQGSFH